MPPYLATQATASQRLEHMSIFNGTYYSLTTDMLPSTALRSGLAPQQPRFRKCCALKSRLPCAVGFPQRLSLRYSTKEVSRHARWRCSSTVSSSRPAPGDEPARSGDTPGPQAEAPSTIHTKNAVVEGRRKGIELMEELKELVKSSNAELKVRPGTKRFAPCGTYTSKQTH